MSFLHLQNNFHTVTIEINSFYYQYLHQYFSYNFDKHVQNCSVHPVYSDPPCDVPAIQPIVANTSKKIERLSPPVGQRPSYLPQLNGTDTPQVPKPSQQRFEHLVMRYD